MQALVRDSLKQYHDGTLNRGDALICIAGIIEAYQSGAPLTRSAVYYFPFWFRAMAWSKNSVSVNHYSPDQHHGKRFAEQSKERRSVVYSIEASAPDSIPAAVAEALNAEPIELPLSPHVLGTCEATDGSAQSDRQAIHTDALKEGHVTGAHVSSSLSTNNSRPDNPVASPESPTNLSGPLMSGLPSSRVAPPSGARCMQGRSSKAYYKGKSLIYVRLANMHFVANGHWEEYLALRRECPETVRLFDSQREMKEALEREGVLA